MQTATVLLLLCLACAASVQGAAPRLEDGDSEAAESLAFNGNDGFKGRSLKQNYGQAYNSYFNVPDLNSPRTGNDPTGSDCYISRSKTAIIDCRKEGTGTDEQQVPACCATTSTSASTSCITFDDGGNIVCNGNLQANYPACCTIRPQPVATCAVASKTGAAIDCKADPYKPIPACCASRTSGTCTVDPGFVWQKSVSCGSIQYAACCPS